MRGGEQVGICEHAPKDYVNLQQLLCQTDKRRNRTTEGGKTVKGCLKTQPIHAILRGFQSMILSQLASDKRERDRERETAAVTTRHLHSSFATKQHTANSKHMTDSAAGDKTAATPEKRLILTLLISLS